MIQQDILRMFIGLLCLVPLSYVIQYISNKTLRYAYSLVLALIIQYFVYEAYMFPIYAQHLIVYAIIKFRGSRKIGGLVTFESMAFLSGYHIYEYLFNYGGWTMNASALLMILVCKYSLLAYNIDDGQAEEASLSPEQLRNRIKVQIGYIDFMGYISFLPTCLIGPPLEYNDYHDFMEKEDVYGKIPSVFRVTGQVLLEMTSFIILYVLGDIYLPLNALKTNEFYQTSSAGYIFLYATLSTYLLRCKYYFGWKLSMGSIHASGVSFDGKGFDRINTVNPWVFETTIHLREKINNWNMSVQEWLRKCIYQRSSIKNRTLRQLYVFGISSFWHGFYPAYYITFGLWFIQMHIHTAAFKYFKSGKPLLAQLYNRSGIIGNIILANLVMFLFSHIATYFLILDTDSCWRLMKSLYFTPQIILVVLAVVFTFLPVPREKGAKKQAIQKKQE